MFKFTKKALWGMIMALMLGKIEPKVFCPVLNVTKQEQVFVDKWPWIETCLVHGRSLLDISDTRLHPYLLTNSPHFIPGRDVLRWTGFTVQEREFIKRWWWIAPRIKNGESLVDIATELSWLQKYLSPDNPRFIPGTQRWEPKNNAIIPESVSLSRLIVYLENGYPWWRTILIPMLNQHDGKWYLIDGTGTSDRTAFVLMMLAKVNARLHRLVFEGRPFPDTDPRTSRLQGLFTGAFSHVNDKIEGCGTHPATCTFAYAIDDFIHMRGEVSDTRMYPYVYTSIHELAHVACIDLVECFKGDGHPPMFWGLFDQLYNVAMHLRLLQEE